MSRFLPVLLTTAVLILGFAACSAQFPGFASTRVVTNMLTDNAFLGIIAVGMTVVIISGGIDLSVGAVIAFTSVAVALLIGRAGLPPLAAFALVLGACAGFGAAMGALIHYLRMPPFIITLAGMFLARGAALLLSTESIPVEAPLYDSISAFALPVPGGGRLTAVALLMLLVFAVVGVLLHATRFGLRVFALGGNSTSTAMMGIRVAPVTIAIYTLSSTLAGLSGIVFSLYTSSGYSLSAVGVELDAIAAVVIGGTLLSGGQGMLFGTFVGVLIQGLILTYIAFDGTLSSWWARIATGLLLFLFIALQQGLTALAERRAARRREAAA
ncbi:galactofuranose ABC transporter, permease protein YjfF [Roseomonas elaeocarpi]|uniref:Galactofuranose ABC transporter, permease protein YjfF n=1 Tax=Roseomonas elaeocarpi TaxID=907779 RepID=A0ABV6JZ62_9PROT